MYILSNIRILSYPIIIIISHHIPSYPVISYHITCMPFFCCRPRVTCATLSYAWMHKGTRKKLSIEGDSKEQLSTHHSIYCTWMTESHVHTYINSIIPMRMRVSHWNGHMIATGAFDTSRGLVHVSLSQTLLPSMVSSCLTIGWSLPLFDLLLPLF